jgi:hypothetical protein
MLPHGRADELHRGSAGLMRETCGKVRDGVISPDPRVLALPADGNPRQIELKRNIADKN